jgi:hypothetical protein
VAVHDSCFEFSEPPLEIRHADFSTEASEAPSRL